MASDLIIGGAPVIGESAFSSCEDLNTISFQDSTLQLGEYAFFSCGKDAAVSFVNCTGTMDKYAFQYNDLVSLTIEGCTLEIEDSAFSSCEDLTAIVFKNSSLEMGEYAFFSAGDAAKVEITDCELFLDDRVFQYASLGTLAIQGGTVETGESTFSSCKNLTAVTIDCPIVILGESAFWGCEDLTTVSVCDNGRTDNTIRIDDGVFQYCEHLSSVTVGNGSIEMGERIFSGCAEGLTVSVDGKAYMTLE